MDNALFEHAAEARAALRSITSDQASDTRNLPDPRTAANLLQDLLADAPRECSILVAALTVGVPAKLRGYTTQGMDTQMAVSLTAATLAERTAFPPEACHWVTAEIASALGLAAPADTTRPSQVPSASSGSPAPELPPGPGHAPETLLATALTTQRSSARQPGRRAARQVSRRLAVSGATVLLAAATAGGYLLGRSERHVITRTATRIEYRTRTKTLQTAQGIPCFTLNGTLSGLGQPTGAIGGDGPINQTTCRIIVGGNGSAQGSYFYAQAPDGSILNLEVAPQGQ
jgi:hypothetical protein